MFYYKMFSIDKINFLKINKLKKFVIFKPSFSNFNNTSNFTLVKKMEHKKVKYFSTSKNDKNHNKFYNTQKKIGSNFSSASLAILFITVTASIYELTITLKQLITSDNEKNLYFWFLIPFILLVIHIIILVSIIFSLKVKWFQTFYSNLGLVFNQTFFIIYYIVRRISPQR